MSFNIILKTYLIHTILHYFNQEIVTVRTSARLHSTEEREQNYYKSIPLTWLAKTSVSGLPSEFLWGIKVTSNCHYSWVFIGILITTCRNVYYNIACDFPTYALHLTLHKLKFTFQCQAKVIHLANSWGRTSICILPDTRKWESSLTSFFLIVSLKTIHVLLLLVQFTPHNSTEVQKTPGK